MLLIKDVIMIVSTILKKNIGGQMSKFNLNQKISDITTVFPKAVEIFKSYQIDFCCGGGQILNQVLIAMNLEPQEIINKINTLYDQYKDLIDSNIDFTNMPLDELADYIVNNHHAYLYENMPIIKELTKTILRVHGENHPELSRVYKLFNTLAIDLEEHLIKEETKQYPAIKAYLASKELASLNKACNIIEELEAEHLDAGGILKELRKVTNNYQLPDDACVTYRKTYQKIIELESDVFQHIHLENNILFPRLFAFKNKLAK